MNVIIVMKNGIMETPLLIKHNSTADAEFQKIAEELLGDDVSEVDFMDDNAIDEVNSLLQGTGIEILWYQDLEINKYKC